MAIRVVMRCRRALLAGLLTAGVASAAVGAASVGAASADGGPGAFVPPGGKIAYALISLHWATYQSADGKVECPQGYNEGPREQYKRLFPDDGTTRTLADTELKREIEGWFPTPVADGLPFHEATGPTALGLNLDGKLDEQDFKNPDGQPGIDNQLYRALGCNNSYRGPQGANDFFDNEEIGKDDYNRLIVEISGIESLAHSAHVTVTVFRGRDPLLADAGGTTYVPGGTQRVDLRWGARFVQRYRGSIEEGVLTTEPGDFAFPWSTFGLPADEYVRDARFRLKLTPTDAEGLIAGYVDLETWYLQTMKSESTHHQSYGQLSPPSLYKSFRRVADAYPDDSGANTAMSSALRAKFVQVFVLPVPEGAIEAALARPRALPYAGPPK
jgi:hypothetical protein